MSTFENSLYKYIEYRLYPFENQGKCYSFRSNSFTGRIQRYNGSQGYVKNGKPGMPDVIACVNGVFVGFELKTEKGRQSPEQKLAQCKIVDAGGKYYLIRSPEDFEKALKELL